MCRQEPVCEANFELPQHVERALSIHPVVAEWIDQASRNCHLRSKVINAIGVHHSVPDCAAVRNICLYESGGAMELPL